MRNPACAVSANNTLMPRWPYASIVLVLCVAAVRAETGKTFSLPESLVLFGNYGELRIATPDRTKSLRPPVDVGYNRGYFAYPSLAPSGDVIAWGFSTGWEKDRPSNRARFALGTYSIAHQRWKTHGDFDDIGNTAYSPTGSRIAFVVRQQSRNELLVFDVVRETMTTAPYPSGGLRTKASMGWSPDATRLVVEIQRGGLPYSPQMSKADEERKSVIGVLDLQTGSVQIFGEGRDPTWSPTGEWIAYFDLQGAKCLLMHPDGTGLRPRLTLRRSWFLGRSFSGTGAVWSADGTQLLLNVANGDELDVVLLDVASGRSTRKTSRGLPVFGWAPYRR